MDARPWRLIITGCGTSHGSPPWGWRHLWSDDPKDHRRRSGAILLGPEGEVLLLDAGPDLMHQLRDPFRDWDGRTYPERCITRCDGVLITHDHADHTHGLDELRHLNRLMSGRSITIHGEAAHLATVRSMFPYCFQGGTGAYQMAKPNLHTQAVIDHRPFQVAGIPIVAFPMEHGPAGRTTGYRIGNLGYCTDAKSIPPASLAHLTSLEVLVLGMLRQEPHETHMNLDEAMAVVRDLRPLRCIFVHMGPEVRYAAWHGRLPAGIELAYDGLTAGFGLGEG